MADAAEAVGGGLLALWLTWGVPAAIVGDTELPLRPERRGKGKWRGKLFGAT
jgi:hypothetical protein